MTAYEPQQWSDLFVAAAGASAALAGLVFVAVSINIRQILEYKGLPERALETILMLLGVLIVSLIGLIPGQSHVALGIELLAQGIVFAIVLLVCANASRPEEPESGSRFLGRLAISTTGSLLLIVGGASVLATSGGGLYWTVAGMVTAIVGAVTNAWVLLVEILR